jgi:predicted dehydrogenase
VADTVRAAVIGVGHLGRHHARILGALTGVTLVATVDTVESRARDAAAASGARVLTDYRALFGEVDAVSIAAPTELHHEIAMPFLERGVAVLVEKPMARTLEEADALIAAASASGATLAVGQTERYNPAVAAVMPLVTSPRFIEVHRLGVFPDRSLDIDVIFDLMIHDIDIILSLVRAPLAEIRAVGIPVLSARADIANVRLEFGDGCVANLTASRVSTERVRKLRFFQPHDYVSLDYEAQQGVLLSLDGGQIRRVRLEPEREEPLRRQLAAFVAAVEGTEPVRVSGEEGRRSLEVALEVNRVIEARLAQQASSR